MADYDYIIVGAGSAGGALAARLSENPSTKILLLEAGAASHPYSRMPLSFGLLIDNPAAARKSARRLELDQRPGVGARPAARLRHLGADGLPRLELARRGAGLHPHRELRRWRWQQRPRHIGAAQGLDRARPEPAVRRAVRGLEGGGLQAQSRLQQRGPG